MVPFVDFRHVWVSESDKHASLLLLFGISYGCKEFYGTGQSVCKNLVYLHFVVHDPSLSSCQTTKRKKMARS